jgi:hypothetical protein
MRRNWSATAGSSASGPTWPESPQELLPICSLDERSRLDAMDCCQNNSGLRHIVTVGRRADGREVCEERAGGPPPNHETARDENAMRIYIVPAAETNSEIREPNLENYKAIA